MLESAQELLGPMDVCDHAGSDPDTISMGFGCGSCTKTGISSADARELYQEAARQQWYSNCVARHRSCVGVTMLRKQLALNLRLSAGIRQNERIIGFYGLLVSASGDCAEGCMAKQRRRRNVGPSPLRGDPPALHRKRRTSTESIDYLSVRRVLLPSTSSEPALKQDSAGTVFSKSGNLGYRTRLAVKTEGTTCSANESCGHPVR